MKVLENVSHFLLLRVVEVELIKSYYSMSGKSGSTSISALSGRAEKGYKRFSQNYFTTATNQKELNVSGIVMVFKTLKQNKSCEFSDPPGLK